MKNNIIFLLLETLVAFSILFSACENDVTPYKKGYFTVKDFYLIENLPDSTSVISYDSLKLFLIPVIENIYLGSNTPLNTIYAINYYADIDIKSLHDYNSEISENQNINDFMEINYHTPIEFRESLSNNYYCIEAENMSNYYNSTGYVLSYQQSATTYFGNYYNNVSLFFDKENPPRTNPLCFSLSSPPDKTCNFQIKITITLYDGRSFEFTSQKITVTP
ncbi:MAG: hypothetical protein ACP5DZ_11265 [Bacteroidales bacterium]